MDTRPALRRPYHSRTPYAALGAVSVIVAIAIASADLLEAQQQELPAGLHVGETFPTLAFPALDDGQPTSLSDFRGERLILHVFASW